MSTYQSYDFIKDINFHIRNKNPIDLKLKSKIFKIYLFKLKIFQLNGKIKKDHPIFREEYFIFVLYNIVYIAKREDSDFLKFDYVEILNGLKFIRLMKLKKLFG